MFVCLYLKIARYVETAFTELCKGINVCLKIRPQNVILVY